MRKNYIYLLFLILFYHSSFAQTTSLRGMYIDSFDDILGNPVKEDEVLHYAQDSSYNYLALYSLHAINLNNSSTANTMASFIKRAKENYGIQYVGAVVESYSGIQNRIVPYNNNRSDDNEKFNVFNLEFEFWTSSSVNPGGYYCTQYLQQANCSCDTSGAFKFFIEQMHLIDSMAAVQQVISETYLGWFNQGQASQIQQNVDRVLLHAYRTGTSSLFSYSKTRLQYLASNNAMVDVAPIFSAEPNFMGPWMETHAQLEAYTQYKNDYDNDNSSWKQYVNILGYQWFDWEFMPKPVPGSFSPTITASGPVSFCSGESVSLTATSGDSYQWSNGATTRTINVNTAGSYICYVTYNGNPYSTPATVVGINNNPTVIIDPGVITSGQLPLSANATAGSGTVSSYQWKLDNFIISGATTSTFISVVSGDYTVVVTNSNGCSTVSSAENVSLPSTNCSTSIPAGLSSTALTEIIYSLNWQQGQTGDSIVVRYEVDNGANEYEYVRMKNIGQSSVTLSGLQPNTTYGWRIKMICGTTSGTYSTIAYFTTGNVSTGIHSIPHVKDVSEDALTYDYAIWAYPNPANENVHVDIKSANSGMGEITLMDMNSRIIYSEELSINKGDNKYSLDISKFSNGIYFLSFKNTETVIMQKLIIGL